MSNTVPYVFPRIAWPARTKSLAVISDYCLSVFLAMSLTFERKDILRTLAKRIDDPFALQTAAETAMRSPKLVALSDGGTRRFTTQDYLDHKARLSNTAQGMADKGGFAVKRDSVNAAVTTQNTQMRKAFGGVLSTEQRAAIKHVLGDKQLACVIGLAGAGKSTMLATANSVWRREGINVHGAALSGKAADGLESASGIASRTLASLETSWQNGHDPIAAGDVLVIDEAGMIGTRQLARVAAKINDIGAKLVMVGDPDQLQPIEAGTPFRTLGETHGAARMTEIHRQREGWQRQATLDLANGQVAKAVAQYAEHNDVHCSDKKDDALADLAEHYVLNAQTQSPSITRLAFAHSRKDVHALNQAIRTGLRAEQPSESEILFYTVTGPRAFAIGERIAFGRNDRALGVKNGMLGTVTKISDGNIRVNLDGDTKRSMRFDPKTYQHFDHGYAVTIHKSQGATVDQAYVLGSRSMNDHLAYVAMSRHREAMHLFVGNDDRPRWVGQRGHDWARELKRNRSGPSLG